MNFIENAPTSAKQIADLREAVGWNRMECCYENEFMTSYFHISVYDDQKLIGYIDTVSNGVTDAYIQDLMVHTNVNEVSGPDMNGTIAHLRRKSICFKFIFEAIYFTGPLALSYAL